MKINYHKSFTKAYSVRIQPNPHLNSRFQQRLKLFTVDPHNPILKDHQLTGAKKHLRSFSIAGDIRVVYRPEKNAFVFIDIGTHNQVY